MGYKGVDFFVLGFGELFSRSHTLKIAMLTSESFVDSPGTFLIKERPNLARKCSRGDQEC